MSPLYDPDAKNRMMLSIDIIMFIIAIISMVFIAINFYNAGYSFGGGDSLKAQHHLIYAGASIAFLAVSMTWIFIRFFRNWGKRLI